MKSYPDLQTYSKRLQGEIYSLEIEKQSFKDNLDTLRNQVTRLEATHLSMIEEILRLQKENTNLKKQLEAQED